MVRVLLILYEKRADSVNGGCTVFA